MLRLDARLPCVRSNIDDSSAATFDHLVDYRSTTKKVPLAFTSFTKSQSFSVISLKRIELCVPAQFTNMSTPPSSWTVDLTALFTSSA